MLSEFDLYLSSLFWFLMVSYAFFTLWLIYSYFSPIGRLLYKAKIIRRGEFKKRYDLPVRGQDFAEYFQFDLTLNKIHNEIKMRKGLINKERSEFETLVGSVNQAVLSVDENLNVRYFNGPMMALMDSFNKEMQSKHHVHLSEAIRSSSIVESFNQVIATGQVVHMVWEHQLTSSTQTRYYDVAISPLFDEKKDLVYGAVSTFHDITDLKNVEKLRDDFVSNASHELKTPLTSIVGYMGALEKSIADKNVEQSKELLTVVQRNVSRLDKLIKDLLDLSKVESSVIEEKESIDLQAMTEGILHELEDLVQSKQQKVDIKIETPLFHGNKLMLEQILFNLVHNAIKYCPPGAAIKIRWFLELKEIVLQVIDNGPGISKDHLGRLFERFYRVDKARTSEVTGTGLGLSIVKNAVQKHSGHVSVSSIPGEGSTFECRFPA